MKGTEGMIVSAQIGAALFAASVFLASSPLAVAQVESGGTSSPPDAAQSSSDPTAAPAAALAPAAPEAAAGIIPIPDYTGDIWSRPALLGDLGGARTSIANHGIQFGIDWNQTVQSVVSGGRDINTAYGGTLDYNATFDLMRMGVLPGAIIKLRGESRYGESINTDAGPLLPVNADFLFPLTSELEDEVPFALTTLTYTQFFSESFAVYFGKTDTFDGDPNEFASGRGLTQFQNLNLIFNAAPLLTVPYDTLAAGILFKPHPFITFVSSLMTTSDTSTTSGFDKVGDGWTWASELQFQYALGHLPGGINVGGSYAWDNSFSSVGRRFVFQPGEGVTPVPDEDTSWSAYSSLWQYLFAEKPAQPAAAAPLNTANGVPDVKGLGLFLRLGIADQDTNPIELAFSGGIGARGLIPGRDHDLIGLGYFVNQLQTRRLTAAVGIEDSNQGFEAFYNLAIAASVGLTFDVQYVESPTERLDDAVILGARLLIRF